MWISVLSDPAITTPENLDMLKKIFVDPDKGDYRIREGSVVYELFPEFEQLPIEKMGRE